MRQMSALDTRLAFTMIRAVDTAPQTLHIVYSVMIWSFEASAAGTSFYNDHVVGSFQIRTIQCDSTCEVSRSPVSSNTHSTNFAAIGTFEGGFFVGGALQRNRSHVSFVQGSQIR